MQSHAHSQFSLWRAPFDTPSKNRQRHVSDTSISIADIAFHQKRCAECDIRELISKCRDRYCFAHDLIKPHASLPERLFDRSMFDLSGFYLPWSEFCSAYRKFRFDPQMSLLDDQRRRELSRWQMFVEQECFARFIRHPDWIRAVLETANLISERGPSRKIFVGDLFDDIIQNVQERNAHEQDDEN